MGVLALLLFVAFNDRAQARYVVAVAEQEPDVVLELRVKGTRQPPAFWNYFPAWLGYDKPPPRHSWSTALPAEVLLRLDTVLKRILQANGLIDISEYRFFVGQLNEIGNAVDRVNAKATWLRVQAICMYHTASCTDSLLVAAHLHCCSSGCD